jgi:hypothetical protein
MIKICIAIAIINLCYGLTIFKERPEVVLLNLWISGFSGATAWERWHNRKN